jgi:hypothetical protein
MFTWDQMAVQRALASSSSTTLRTLATVSPNSTATNGRVAISRSVKTATLAPKAAVALEVAEALAAAEDLVVGLVAAEEDLEAVVGSEVAVVATAAVDLAEEDSVAQLLADSMLALLLLTRLRTPSQIMLLLEENVVLLSLFETQVSQKVHFARTES